MVQAPLERISSQGQTVLSALLQIALWQVQIASDTLHHLV